MLTRLKATRLKVNALAFGFSPKLWEFVCFNPKLKAASALCVLCTCSVFFVISRVDA